MSDYYYIEPDGAQHCTPYLEHLVRDVLVTMYTEKPVKDGEVYFIVYSDHFVKEGTPLKEMEKIEVTATFTKTHIGMIGYTFTTPKDDHNEAMTYKFGCYT